MSELKNKKKHKVLLDIKPALYAGFCGIAQENRMLLKAFDKMNERVDLSSFFYSQNILPSKLVRKKPKDFYTFQDILIEMLTGKSNKLEAFHSAYLSIYKNHFFLLMYLIMKFSHKFQKFFSLLYMKKKINIYQIPNLLNHYLNRKIFKKTSLEFDRGTINIPIYLSSYSYLYEKILLKFGTTLKMNTQNFDFVIFPELSSIKVSDNTKKIIRYHDSFPITYPDFCFSDHSIEFKKKLKKTVLDGSHFVCNSNVTRTELLKIHPELENRVDVIPALVETNYRKKQNSLLLKFILKNSISKILNNVMFNLNDYNQKLVNDNEFEYFFTMSSLEPKKNIEVLINAWNAFHSKNKNYKLVLVASSGWMNEREVSLLKHSIINHSIIHLEKLTIEEIQTLFSHAKAFIFPSIVEGFGAPPLEAIFCDCPVIASDIEAHREVLDDAALYFNPNSDSSLEKALYKIIDPMTSKKLIEELIEKGQKRKEVFSKEKISSQWLELLDKLNYSDNKSLKTSQVFSNNSQKKSEYLINR